jgi:energy-coupling factor transporter ATP-binding protein EcfA2
LKVEKFTTKDGQTIEVGKFTLLVGPNNAGKSQTLKDINKKLTLGHEAETVLLPELTVNRPSTFEELLADLDVRPDPINIGHHTVDGVTSAFEQNSMLRLRLDNSRQQFEQNSSADFTFQRFGKFRVFYLDSESRLSLASSCQNFIPEESSPKTLLQALYGSFGRLDKALEDAFNSTFGMNIKLDYSAGLRLRFAVSEVFDAIPEDPRSAYPIMKGYPSLEIQGDGFRSFVAVVLSLLLSKNKVVLLDEPEAFLHPEQARRLGQWMSDQIESFPCQVIVASHNSNFLAGLLSGKQPADIYRLNRRANITRFHKITAEATQALSKSPILSSQRVLEGIFARGVVVCEADSDRVVYNSVAIHEHDNQEVLFIHAHNKQTIKDVINLLKDACIPASAIVDIDILNSQSDLENLLSAFGNNEGVDEILSLRRDFASYIDERTDDHLLCELQCAVTEFLEQLQRKEHTLSGARGALGRIRKDSTKWAALKTHGIALLGSPSRDKAEEILSKCKVKGLFVVPVGELESWMNLGVRKNRWVIPALEEILSGKCPSNLSEFIESVIQSIYNQNGS